MNENPKIYTKNCPSCGAEQKYSKLYSLNKAIKKNTKCYRCSKLGSKNPMFGKTASEHHFYGKKHSDDVIEKIVRAKNNYYEKNSGPNLGRIFSDESREKMSETRIKKQLAVGENNPMFGKEHSEITKKKMRCSYTEYMKQKYENEGQFYPNYNVNSIPIIEQKAKELGITDLQHAENGGEYYIKELGYFVDGYSKEKNIVIEYHEKKHKYQIEKDLKRQQEIEKVLNCKFVIIEE